MAHDVALLRLFRMFAQEGQQMPRILNRWLFAPLHFDGRERFSLLDNEINFHPVTSAQIMQAALAEVLQPLPQLHAHPLLEKRPRIHLHDVA